MNNPFRFTVCAAAASMSLSSAPALGDVSVLMSRGDHAGSGANLAETILNPRTVSSGNFGKLASLRVEGFVYAQPLIAAGVHVGGKTRNVLYVATMTNVVYAFDADDFTSTGGLLWQVRFSNRGAVPVPNADLFGAAPPDNGSATFNEVVRGDIGIMGTPVIDAVSNTIYVLSRWKSGGSYSHALHALDLSTGAEKFNGPAQVSFTDSTGLWTFVPMVEGQRPGLLLVGNNIVAAFGSLQDLGDYHGWLMAFNKTTLSLVGAFCTSCGPTQNGVGDRPPFGGGFWQSGRAPAVDSAGLIYAFTGNGWPTGIRTAMNPNALSCLTNNPVPDMYFGESVVKLDPTHLSNGNQLLSPLGSVLPDDWCSMLDMDDMDLGGSGPVLIAENSRSLLLGGGKDGVLRMFDANAIVSPYVDTGLIPGSPEVQDITVSPDPKPGCDHHVMSGPVYWNRSSGSPRTSLLIVSRENDYLRSYMLTFPGGQPTLSPMPPGPGQSAYLFYGHPGGILTLTANGSVSGTGIVWVAHAQNTSCDFNTSAVFNVKLGTLRAYNADNLSQLLWTSDVVGSRDALGYFSKFTPPTVVNGKVYVASSPAPDIPTPYTYYSGTVYSTVQVYGMNPPAVAPVVMNNEIRMAPILLMEED
jgi:hypothetical protein